MSNTAPSVRFGTNISHWISQSALDRDIMRTFFTRDDAATISRWGMDHIRLPVDYPLFESEGWPGHYSQEGLGWIDRALDWCEAEKLWCVLDMHVLPGHVFFAESRAHNAIFDPQSPARRRALEIWRMLARRYKGRKVVFEILNEPIAQDNDAWNELARSFHAAIRQEAPDQWIMVPSNEWDHVKNFSSLHFFEDARTLYTFHYYEPILFTHQNASWIPWMNQLAGAKVPYPGPFNHSILEIDSGFPLDLAFMRKAPYGAEFLESLLAPVLDFRSKHGAQVYCGEFGTVTFSPPEDRLRWYGDLCSIFARHGIGFANWDYKSDDFGIKDYSGKVNGRLLETLQRAAER